jgi:hypothetical protein
LFEVKRRTGSKEFIVWQAYLEEKRRQEREQYKKEEWYWAQIAFEVHRSNVQIDQNIRNAATLEQFLLNFEVKEEITNEESKAKRSREAMMNAKLFFSCLTGASTEALFDGAMVQDTKQGEELTGADQGPPKVQVCQ